MISTRRRRVKYRQSVEYEALAHAWRWARYAGPSRLPLGNTYLGLPSNLRQLRSVTYIHTVLLTLLGSRDPCQHQCKHASTSEWWWFCTSYSTAYTRVWHQEVLPGHPSIPRPPTILDGGMIYVHLSWTMFGISEPEPGVEGMGPLCQIYVRQSAQAGEVEKVVCHLSMVRSHDWHCCSDSFHVIGHVVGYPHACMHF